ncbi:vegetative cell wall protein gp1-like [Macadamia integrifolia]|uniref:vegetative cell wall protein gp1-like n=1 Tax=Macadamia integrifolia TaxID=60698 RepID=UPI001C4FD422|nr:vegetative cell wall protein gp1-like [Macadamia integrifolia]
MGRLLRLCSSLLFVMLLLLLADLHFVVSADPPQISPSPAPESGGSNSPSPSPSPSPKSGAPAPGPSSDFYSPPPPPQSDLAPTPSPAPAPAPSPVTSPSPSPSDDASDINHGSKGTAGEDTADSEGSSSDEGLKGGQKAGIAIGVIASACIFVLFGVIYKKRQDNIRRSQYSYTARRELL